MEDRTIPLIKAEKISLRRNGKTILQDIDWDIYGGQNWAVVGPNGCGKSLLLQVMQGKLPCSAGRVTFADPSVTRRISQVSFELHHQLIAREQDNEVARHFSNSGDNGTLVRTVLERARGDTQDGRKLDEIIRWTDLKPLLEAPLLTLSNGEMRKLLIARALLKNPQILVLDEPYDGLDVHSRQVLMEVVGRLPQMGVQMLFVTHRLEEISESVTHLLLMKEGQVLLSGERKQVLESELVAQLDHPPEKMERILPLEAIPPARASAPDQANDPTVVLKNVTVMYGSKVVIDRLNWAARRNENWAIVGPNGAGKSTLLRLISADHLQAYANEIYLFGRRRGSGESIWEIKRRIGVLSPEFQILYRQDLPVREVVLSGFFDSVGLYGRANGEQKAKADYWIKFLGIEGLARQPFAQLSYGHRRIVLLARALVKSPELLLLDEPCQGLDHENRSRLIDTVSAICQVTGMQVFFVTHRRNEFPSCITHILEFSKGPGDQGPYQHKMIEL